MKQPIKMTPGDDIHLSLLMAPHSLNLAVGQLREQLLGYGRAAFEAGKAGQCLHQIQEPEADIWPCVNIDVDESGKITNAKLYSPGLPAGNHDVYPVRVPYMDEHTEAWRACVDELEKAVPGFMSLGNMNGIECAVAAIRGLSERAKHQEPAAAEQAAWHAGLDEGRAQAAPAAVAVPDGIAKELADMLASTCNGLESYRNTGPWTDADEDHLAECRELLARYTLAADASASREDSLIRENAVISEALAWWRRDAQSRGVAARLLLENLSDEDCLGDGRINTTRVRELLEPITRDTDDFPREQNDSPVEAAPLAATPAAAAPVVLPEPLAFYDGNKWYADEAAAICACADLPKLQKVYTEQQVRALLAGISAPAAVAVAVPDGWREKFAADVYADLAAADNQDVPLEEYPARILKVLDSIVGPRHPVVIKWRNDAIRNCIAIAYKYCRDPESHKYLKQDLEAMLTTEPAPQAQADARDALPEKLKACQEAFGMYIHHVGEQEGIDFLDDRRGFQKKLSREQKKQLNIALQVDEDSGKLCL